jgi:hypothetical protein
MTLLKKSTCRVLIVALLMLSFQSARAGLIGTEQAAAETGAPSPRSLVMSVLERTDTASQLQAQGIDIGMARERVASMTDQEVRELARAIQSAPAGGTDGATVAVVFFTLLLLWFFAFRM